MILAKLRQTYSKMTARVVEVGWMLRTNEAGFIWSDPRRFRRADPEPTHAKALAYCPAVIDHEARLVEIPCPIDLRMRLEPDAKGELKVVDADGSTSNVDPGTFAGLVSVLPRDRWRHPDRPLLQMRTPYLFVADQPVYMTQLPPFLSYKSHAWPGLLIGGRIPIHVWPRKLAWGLEWHDISKELVLTRGEPWFYCRFETLDPHGHVRLVQAEMTKDLEAYLTGMASVAGYMNGTFSLFDTARRRRPHQLLVKARAQ